MVKSSVKSAERYRNGRNIIEICPEMDGVSDRAGIYKLATARMCTKALTNLRMYGSKTGMRRNCAWALMASWVRLSKNQSYEKPYGVTGTIYSACVSKH